MLLRSLNLRGLVTAALLLLSQLAVANVFDLGREPQLDLNPHIQYLEDFEGRLQLQDVTRKSQWATQSDHSFNQGYSTSAWWLKLELRNDSEQPQERLLELGYAVLDHVDVYVVSEQGLAREFNSGDELEFHQRPHESRYFAFPLSWDSRQTLTIYLRLQSSSAIQAPLVLWQKGAYTVYENNSSILQGLYYGGMIVIVVYNLLIFIALRERTYLYYVGFVISLPLFFASLSGQAYRYLWPESVVWNGLSIPVFISLSILFGALFTRRFLNLANISPGLDRLLLAFAAVGACMLVISFFTSYKTSIHLLVPLTMLTVTVNITAAVYAWSRRVEAAPTYVIAWGCFVVGTLVLSLNKLNIVPTNVVTEYAIQIGSVLEAVLLSLGMAERINSERRLRYEAQEDSLTTQRRLNTELEQRVAERTSELAALNHKLQELSTTDQLTQLKNRRYLETAMETEWLRCLRFQHPLSLLILDVDHFKQVNDRYGHSAGDLCLKRVADQLLQCVRFPSDTVARYGGEEFCMILPETDAAGAYTVAERIRRKLVELKIATAAETFSVTASIGLCSVVPSAATSLEKVVNAADAALYQSKQNGRNRTTLYRLESDVVPFAN